jgi:hypothetical protein
MAMDWNSTNQARKQKLFWDNAVKAYPRAPVK